MISPATLGAKPLHSITLRAFVLGLVLVVVNAYWLQYAVWGGLLHTYMSLFANTVFSLFVLVLLNLLLKRLSPTHVLLHESEFFTIYAMIVMISTVVGNTNMGYLVYILPHPSRFATAENDWQNLFGGYIPSWFTVQNKPIVDGYYEGNLSFFTTQTFQSWVVPLLAWSAILFVLYFVLLCMNVILRRQFAEHERLTYPITRLPLEMGGNPSAFFKSRSMWLGFGLVAVIEVLNGLHFLYPYIPSIPVKYHDISYLFSERPWNAVGTILLSFYPFVVGLSFFMPLDLSFSSWFFYLWGKG